MAGLVAASTLLKLLPGRGSARLAAGRTQVCRGQSRWVPSVVAATQAEFQGSALGRRCRLLVPPAASDTEMKCKGRRWADAWLDLEASLSGGVRGRRSTRLQRCPVGRTPRRELGDGSTSEAGRRGLRTMTSRSLGVAPEAPAALESQGVSACGRATVRLREQVSERTAGHWLGWLQLRRSRSCAWARFGPPVGGPKRGCGWQLGRVPSFDALEVVARARCGPPGGGPHPRLLLSATADTGHRYALSPTATKAPQQYFAAPG